jgi:hypothetical protein
LSTLSPLPLLCTAAAAAAGWNNVSIELWTHARDGLSENDFIVAAKFDDIDLADLLSKKQPEL